MAIQIKKHGQIKAKLSLLQQQRKYILELNHMKEEIIKYYKELYEIRTNPEKTKREEFLIKINEILLKLLSHSDIQSEKPIYQPKSHALDYNDFTQSKIEKIFYGATLREEIINFQKFTRSNL